MGTALGPKYIPYTYMDPLGLMLLMLAGGGMLAFTAAFAVISSR